jgi:hypothetical protein
LYAAKDAGRNCYVGPSGIAVTGVIGSSRPAFKNEDRARANASANAEGDLALNRTNTTESRFTACLN